MARQLNELINEAEHAWPAVVEWLQGGRNRSEILRASREDGERALLALQVTTRSPMGAIAFEAGGILFDGGWVRLLGAGAPRMRGSIVTWNGLDGSDPAPRLDRALVVAHDAVGGFFVLNGGGLDARPGSVLYAEPDTVKWMDMEMGYSDFVRWLAHGDLAEFYRDVRWPQWENDIGGLAADRGFNFFPPLWSREGQAARLDPRSRRDVPMGELWGLWHEQHSKLGADRE